MIRHTSINPGQPRHTSLSQWPALWILALLLLSACSNVKPVANRIAAPTSTVNFMPAMENRIAEQLFAQASQELAKLNPDQSLLASMADPNGQWTSVSLAHQETRTALQNQWWNRIKNDVDPRYLSFHNRISYRLFQYNTEMTNLRFAFRYHQFHLNPIGGVHLTPVLYLLNRQPAQSVTDLESYIARIIQTAELIEESIADLQRSQEQGIVPPRSLLASVIKQTQSLGQGSPLEFSSQPNLLMEDFRIKMDELELIERERGRLLQLMARALVDRFGPAYWHLQDYLEKLEMAAPAALAAWQMPEGESFYRQQLRFFTGTPTVPDSLHIGALKEVEKLLNEMAKPSNQSGEIPETADRYFADSTAGRQSYLSTAVDIITAAPEKTSTITNKQATVDLVIKAVESFREDSSAITDYFPPVRQGNQVSILYVNLADMQTLAKNQMEARIYHDTIPGLHLLHSVALRAADQPSFRSDGYYPSYHLGWAAYMETAAGPAGFYRNHQSISGQLSTALARACAVVVDTGMHWKRWTRAQALDYLDTHQCGNRRQNLMVLQQVIANPGWSAAHLAGQQQFQGLQDRARELLGDRFDIRKYHDYLLDQGPLPWNLLGEVVDVWIAEVSGPEPPPN